ncbi:hypothetical protein ACHAO1_001863 [Botrytis cinerea]
MHERANGIPNPDINNIGIATGEESVRQYLILKALDAFSAEEITRIGIFLSRNRLVSLWLQNLLEDVEEKGKREGKVFGYRWVDIVRELVVGNRISGSPNISPIANRNYLNPDSQSGCQLGRNIAKLLKDGDVDMMDIKKGLQEIEKRRTAALEVLLQAVEQLSTDKAQRIVMEILDRNAIARDWFEEQGGLKTTPGHTPDREESINLIKTIGVSNLRRVIRVFIIENGFIEEILQKKLLVEQKDGTFTIRDFGQNSVHAIPRDGSEQAFPSALPS